MIAQGMKPYARRNSMMRLQHVGGGATHHWQRKKNLGAELADLGVGFPANDGSYVYDLREQLFHQLTRPIAIAINAMATAANFITDASIESCSRRITFESCVSAGAIAIALQ